MVADEIALENKEKVSKAVSESNKNRNSNSVLLDANETKIRDRSTNTREQRAKIAGVSAGTVARYNKDMNSNEKDLKEKVKTEQVAVNKAYEEVRKRETRVCKTCGKDKKIIDFFGNDTI